MEKREICLATYAKWATSVTGLDVTEVPQGTRGPTCWLCEINEEHQPVTCFIAYTKKDTIWIPFHMDCKNECDQLVDQAISRLQKEYINKLVVAAPSWRRMLPRELIERIVVAMIRQGALRGEVLQEMASRPPVIREAIIV
jgi:hypothetical protein